MGNSSTIMFLYIGAIFAVMYFFFIRPQSQKMKDAKKFIDEVVKGDKIVTTGGIHGTVDEIHDTTILLRIDSHVRVTIDKSAVSAELTQAAKALAEKK
ncbi:MAG TPA: preprotein translocase subunit YajC [Chitinophagales bacterium]